MVNMNKILNSITDKGADKSMRENMASNAGLLDRKQFNQFIREIELNTTILYDAAFRRMEREKEVTSGVLINGRVLQDAYLKDTHETKPDLKEAELGFGMAELNAHKLRAKTHIDDDELEDNIETEQFQNTLLSLMASRIGEDLEALAIYGDTTLDYNAQPLFHTYDGWVKKATIGLKSSELGTSASTKNFDVHANTIEAMFDAILRALPLRIRQSKLMSNFVFYVPYEVEDAYRNLLKSRGTALGDSAQTGNIPLYYKKYPVKYCPTLDAEDGRSLDNTVTTIGGIPSLWKWGVYKDVKLEPERKADIERTNFYYRTRCAVGLEWNASLITAKLTADEAAKIQDEAKT